MDNITLDESFEILGSGFAARESVVVSLEIDDSLQRIIADALASDGGAFRVSIASVGKDPKISSRIRVGDVYTVLASGSEGSLASAPIKIIEEQPTLEQPTPTPIPKPSSPATPTPRTPATLVGTVAVTGAINTFWAAGFGPGETVSLGIVGGPVILVARDANESGAVMLEARIDLDPGVYTAIATGSSGLEAAWPLVVVAEK
jgi:hypothetical protein